MVLSMEGGSPWWNCTGPELQQSTLSGGNLSFKNETLVKGFQFHEDDSPSTQSTGQSYTETASVDAKIFDKNVLSLQPAGFSGLHTTPEEDQSKSTVSFQDCVFPYQPIDYLQSVCFPHADPYGQGSVTTAYAPYPGAHALMMGLPPTRVALLNNPFQNGPIYVNAKQYRAIMRRRECRAKLDAQNKILRARKPYLHESRHRHAINRARGTGGRFLNKKKLQDSEGNVEESGGGFGGISNSSLQLELNVVKEKGSDVYHQLDNPQEISYNGHFHQEEYRFSIYQPHSDGGGECNSSGGGGGGGGGFQRFVSVVP